MQGYGLLYPLEEVEANKREYIPDKG